MAKLSEKPDNVDDIQQLEAESQESHIEASQEELASLTGLKLKDRLRERGRPVRGMS